MVQEQGECLDNIEYNIESADINVETGVQELMKAGFLLFLLNFFFSFFFFVTTIIFLDYVILNHFDNEFNNLHIFLIYFFPCFRSLSKFWIVSKDWKIVFWKH